APATGRCSRSSCSCAPRSSTSWRRRAPRRSRRAPRSPSSDAPARCRRGRRARPVRNRTIFTLHSGAPGRYGRGMEVPVSALRAELKSWIERAREGEEVVITERGVPVARLTGVATADLVTELVRDGVLVPPAGERPVHAVPAAADVARA